MVAGSVSSSSSTALSLYLLMVAINTARFGFNWPDFPISRYLVGFAIATAVQLFVNYLVGLYERENRLGGASLAAANGGGPLPSGWPCRALRS